MWALMAYPKCREGYSAFGCCICRPPVPNCEGTFHMNGGIDLSCAKKIIIGDPVVGICNSKQDENAGLCYPKCGKGYNGIGPVCWG